MSASQVQWESALERAYEQAWSEWFSGEDAALWDGVAGDGLGPADGVEG